MQIGVLLLAKDVTALKIKKIIDKKFDEEINYKEEEIYQIGQVNIADLYSYRFLFCDRENTDCKNSSWEYFGRKNPL